MDYRPLSAEEELLRPRLRSASWLTSDLAAQARSYAITQLVLPHLHEVKERREAHISKTEAAVNERLTKEISYWDARAAQLKEQEAAGKTNARVNSQLAQQRADELQARLTRRLAELEDERKLFPLPPVIVGGLLIVPQGLLNALTGHNEAPGLFAHETRRIEQAAMSAVMQIECRLGYEPRDVSADKCGYDIESRIPATGQLRFIEVKGRARGAEHVILTKNEILTALNKPDAFILALVEVDGQQTLTHYIQHPFQREPDFAATSVIYHLASLLKMGNAMTM